MLQDSSLSAPIYEKFIHILALFFFDNASKDCQKTQNPCRILKHAVNSRASAEGRLINSSGKLCWNVTE